jgi:hypothetical protein
MKANRLYNCEKILTNKCLMVVKGLWASMRYSISLNNVDFSYKPLITMVNYNNMGEIDIENIDGDNSINKTMIKVRSKLNDSICGLVSFPMKMAFEKVGNKEEFVTCLVIVSKLGILDVFMASRSGCDFIKYGIDKIMQVELPTGPMDLESAISMIVDLEVPVDTPHDMEIGYYIVEDGSTFFFQDEDGSICRLDQVNSVILGERDHFENDPTSEELFNNHCKIIKQNESEDFSDEDFDLDDDSIAEESEEESESIEWI